jgi:hypothetical protein
MPFIEKTRTACSHALNVTNEIHVGFDMDDISADSVSRSHATRNFTNLGRQKVTTGGFICHYQGS